MTSLTRKLVWSAAALVLAGTSAWHAGAAIFARSDPGLVHAVDPTQPRALSVVVDLRAAATNPPKAPSSADAELLRKSLARDPLSSRTLRQLSQAEASMGHQARAKALLAAAGKASRRDEMAQVLLAREAALAEDLGKAVLHIDAALSGSRSADATVFPLLARLLGNEDFRAEAAPYLGRVWGPPFLLYAAQNAPPGEVLDLVLANPDVQRQPRYERFRSELVHHLAAKGLSDQAVAYARSVSARPADLDETGFSPATLAPGLAPVTWRIQNSGGIYVSAAADGVIVSAEATARGRVLERVFSLRPGSYQMRTTARGIVNPGQLRGKWTIACAQSGKEKVLVEAASEIGSVWRVAVPFQVSPACPAIRVTFDSANTDDQKSTEIQLDRFVISKRAE